MQTRIIKDSETQIYNIERVLTIRGRPKRVGFLYSIERDRAVGWLGFLAWDASHLPGEGAYKATKAALSSVKRMVCYHLSIRSWDSEKKYNGPEMAESDEILINL